MIVCSYCSKEDITVSRHLFDGMCADCTTLALYDDKVSEKAKANNLKLSS